MCVGRLSNTDLGPLLCHCLLFINPSFTCRQLWRDGFCCPGQMSVVPPHQPATPIFGALNKLKININLRQHIAVQTPKFQIFAHQIRPPSKVPPETAAFPFLVLLQCVLLHIEQAVRVATQYAFAPPAIRRTLRPISSP